MATATQSIEQLSINTIRTLSMDAVQAANSGHPGTPMALAPIAYELWANWLRYDPQHPHWPARDRFVLSCGHASMLLYSVLHLAGVKKADDAAAPAVSIQDVRNFRQLHSPCAGHPEFGEVTGAETTTGPLGQGVANSVGMAIASKWFASQCGEQGSLMDFNVYALCSDGDLMEGVCNEAASLAGHLKLGNLCWIYDDNKITIEGHTDLAFSEDVASRFESLGWQAVQVDDANDLAALRRALNSFQTTHDRPTLIIVRSIIGFGAPKKQNTAAAHGAPLGAEEVAAAKNAYDWPTQDAFHVPVEVPEHFANTLGKRGAKLYADWTAAWTKLDGSRSEMFRQIFSGQLPKGWESALDAFVPAPKPAATRASSGKVLNVVGKAIPWLIGGSADLAESNKSLLEFEGAGHFSANDYGGRNFHFGIREHAMASICNGMALCGIRPYGATFFVFTDYLRPALRLSALMKLPVLYILTHDSIGLGEDGPTHQPVEHLAACRAIPNLLVIRPADAAETVEAYRAALQQRSRPTALVLSRQNVAEMDRSLCNPATDAARGAYVLWQPESDFDVILIGTGSEVELCVTAARELHGRGIRPRVVSMPCWELFDEQTPEYRESVLPANGHARLAVEAGIEMGWQKYLGARGQFIGMRSFGASAPAEVLYEHFGITVAKVVDAAMQLAAK